MDHGNVFDAIASNTHGPKAKGIHTTAEAVIVLELVRIARVYELTTNIFEVS